MRHLPLPTQLYTILQSRRLSTNWKNLTLPVYQGEEAWMHQIEYLAMGPGMPVLLMLWHVFQGARSVLKCIFEGGRDSRVRFVHSARVDLDGTIGGGRVVFGAVLEFLDAVFEHPFCQFILVFYINLYRFVTPFRHDGIVEDLC